MEKEKAIVSLQYARDNIVVLIDDVRMERISKSMAIEELAEISDFIVDAEKALRKVGEKDE